MEKEPRDRMGTGRNVEGTPSETGSGEDGGSGLSLLFRHPSR